MGNIRSNAAKWFNFVDGTRLYGGIAQGAGVPNLDVAIEQSVGNELDAIFAAVCGDTVLGATSWKVIPGTTNLSIVVQTGRAFMAGQPAATTSNSGDIVLAANTALIKVFAEMDDAQTTFDLTKSSWTPRFGSTTGALPANSIQLATVTTTGITAAAIPLANITDTRPIHEAQAVAVAPITEIAPDPNEAQKSLRQILGMLAYRFREVIGSATPPGDWKDPIPGGGLASLYNIWAKFNATTGHKHSGTSNDGPLIPAANSSFVPVPGSTNTGQVIGITATTVQTAIEQLNTRKLALNGTQAMSGPLTLSGDPTSPLHAVTLQYVNNLVNMKQVVNVAMDAVADSYQVPLVETSMLLTPLVINARGGVIELKPGGQMQAVFQSGYAFPNFLKYEFKVYRNGALLYSDYVIPGSQLLDPETLNDPAAFFFDIPTFFDKPGGSTVAPLATTYDFRIKITVNFSPFSPYYVPSIRGNRWWAIES